MKKVAVVGVGQLPFRSRYADSSYQSLAFEATKKALDDAGLAIKDIEAVIYSIYCPLMMRQEQPDIFLQDYLGLQGKPSLRVSSGANTGGCSMYAAFSQVISGMADVVLLLGVQKGSDFYSFETRSRGDGLNRGFAISGDTIWGGVAPGGTPPGSTVKFLIPHIEKYGGPTAEQIARVSVKNHKNALVNPNAQLKVDLTVEDVLNARIIAWPLTIYDCCLMSDGASALILVSEEKAKKFTSRPIWISGVAVSYYPLHRLENHMLGRLLGVAEASKRAYKMASIVNPVKELDVVELHDLTAALEILTYEELGLCELGEGGRLIDEGIVEKTGELPVNPSGGRIACGHVASVSEISSACDVVRQLRGDAGNIQVPIRRGKGLVESKNGNADLCSSTIFQGEVRSQ